MARVLITGAGGGLGQVFSGLLTRPGASLAPAFPGEVQVASLTRQMLDISRRETVEEAVSTHKPDIILNCAGQTQVDYCESYQWEAFLVNRDGAEHVARVATKHGALPVFFSTDLVFDGSKRTPYTEDDPPNPLGIFADSKLAGELMTMKHAPRHLILRSGWVYGHPGKHFLRIFQEGIQENEILFGFDDQVAQPTLAVDFCEAVLHLLRSGQAGRFHVASPGFTTQYKVMLRMKEILDIRKADFRPIMRSPGGRQAMRPKMSVLDCAKAIAAGASCRPLEEGLKDFANLCRIPMPGGPLSETKRRSI